MPPVATGDVERAAAALQEEPLWHASLGAKELFHSNMLAWLAETYPGETREVFAPWLLEGDDLARDQVMREVNHLDLILAFHGFTPLIVENKAFAYPDDRQLDRYTTGAIPRIERRLHATMSQLVMLSLMDPGWPDRCYTTSGRTWAWVSYRELGSRLRDLFHGGSGYASETVIRYSRILEMLSVVLDRIAISEDRELVDLDPERQRILVRARLDSLATKARFLQLRQLLRLDLEPGSEGAGFNVGFTNGLPLVECFWTFRSVGAKEDRVGWQYQNHQWRLAMQLRTLAGRGESDRARRMSFAAEHETWFDFDALSRAVGDSVSWGAPRTISTGFNRYDPDFVYRYRRVNAPSVSHVRALASATSRAAVEFVDRFA
jgi:hypothetical protein